MTDVLGPLAIGLLAGVAVSGASHASLWWSVRRATRARRPAAWLALSALARIVLVAVGLAALAWMSPWAPAGGLVGFLTVRTLAVRWALPETGGPAGRGSAVAGTEGRA
jgi:F1F0 ATPase subunit 2